mmetsp:Transcript_19472/g.40792  ORF Transcript_19472/g.40792 Transcript_19472/m.40792 type:complete len:759 (-) Transcript_19472:224-2500(-)|eukprot:CAMPEP_0171342926 /NCGR_PEP_ID=MMETSP0878-20121228/15737_1 /TAXON_ID=67004 /ORGANISM="Thalassiosira weissflogii, Strain CCMP1336" /LENGTH=758 /DNA_ID=CAMNT_0011845731 /DNA_START=203 /DNA_END=2479 /DNA_ORIENTATION=-
MTDSKISPESLRSLAKYLRVPKGSPLKDVSSAISILWENVLITEMGDTSSPLDENSALQLAYMLNTCFDVNLSTETLLRENFAVKDCCKEVVKHWSGLAVSSRDDESVRSASIRGVSPGSLKEHEVPLEGSNLSNKSEKSSVGETRTESSVNRKSPTSLFSSHGFINGDEGHAADNSSEHRMEPLKQNVFSDADSYSTMDLRKGQPVSFQSEDDDSRYLPAGVKMHGASVQPLFDPVRNFQKDVHVVGKCSEDDDSRYLSEGYSINSQTKLLSRSAFIPHTLPSLFDSAMSVSTMNSTGEKSLWTEDKIRSEENTREGPEGERDDYESTHAEIAIGTQVGRVPSDPMASTSSAFLPAKVNPPTDMPDPRMTIGGESDLYIMDLERINEESSGHDQASLSRTDQTSVSSNQKGIHHATAISSVQSGNGTPSGQKHKNIQAAEYSPSHSKQSSKHYQQSAQFYNFRHQYYTEQYHYIDDQYYHAGEHNDGTDSTCSSVTLSQAFHPTRGDESCNSSIAEDSYAEAKRAPSYISNVSSVTLSQALSVERHEHEDQGFYVATRLGDFVAAPPESGAADKTEKEIGEKEAKMHSEAKIQEEEEMGLNKGAEKETENDDGEKDTMKECDSGTYPLTNVTNDTDNSSNESHALKVMDNSNSVDGASNTSTASIAGSTQGNDKDSANPISQTVTEKDIIETVIPECGVVPTVVAAATQRSMGMLLPWHSTRSIDYYRYGGRGGRRKRGASGPRSILSHSSIHTFRG